MSMEQSMRINCKGSQGAMPMGSWARTRYTWRPWTAHMVMAETWRATMLMLMDDMKHNVHMDR